MPYLGRLLCGSPLLLALILSKNWDFRGKNRATITIDLIVFIANIFSAWALTHNDDS
jgi:hypothetical protein